MKKLIALLLAAVTMLSMMAACGNAADDAADDKFVIGVCQLIKHDALDAATQGFMDALKEALGDRVEFKLENAAGDSNTCSTIVNTFVNDNVDLILANATPALQAAASATGEIPILGTSITEYGVALEIEGFNGTVGGNISGTSDLAPLDEQAAMLAELFPDAKNVGLLYCSAEANSTYQVETVKKELEGKGIACTLYPFADTNDLQAVVQKAADTSDVIYVPTDNQCASAGETIESINHAKAAGVPIISGEENACAIFGAATLTISYYDLGVTTGKMAAQILKGEADIATMPIAYAEATKKYNKEICDDLQLTIPEGYTPIGQ